MTSRRVRLTLAGTLTLLAMSIAVYTLWKPDTTAGDLVFLPESWVPWLDAHGDLRTMLMAMAIAALPACLLGSHDLNRLRRWILMTILLVLLGLEWGQRWIPSRGFGWPDVLYTVAGVVVIEALVIATQWSTAWCFSANRD
ncbi:hypothetical protein [Neorhodopirellula lusitana]|uniref:hypothetical protein n=1 Tax=Neorhodopirellula lusitana TaxID=445327 RepID=UPI00384BF95E